MPCQTFFVEFNDHLRAFHVGDPGWYQIGFVGTFPKMVTGDLKLMMAQRWNRRSDLPFHQKRQLAAGICRTQDLLRFQASIESSGLFILQQNMMHNGRKRKRKVSSSYFLFLLGRFILVRASNRGRRSRCARCRLSIAFRRAFRLRISFVLRFERRLEFGDQIGTFQILFWFPAVLRAEKRSRLKRRQKKEEKEKDKTYSGYPFHLR